MKRRDFIKGISATLAASTFLPYDLKAMSKNNPVGIQLYSLSEQVSADFTSTLQKIAAIGYKTLEAAGYADGAFYGHSPKEYLKVTNGLGLQPVSSHAGFTLQNAQTVIDDTLEAGMKYLVLPSIPKENRRNLDDYRKLADQFNMIGQLCNLSGLRFAYHNHAFEFDVMDGMVPYDILLDMTDGDLVAMQPDFYWMVYGGVNPMDYFTRYPGRFELWHVKDMDNTEKRESTEIGNGIIDYQNIFREKYLAGMKYFFLEQESFKMDPFKSIEKSYRYLCGIDQD